MIFHFCFWHQFLWNAMFRVKQCFLLLPICVLLCLISLKAAPEHIELQATAYRTYEHIEINGEFNEADWKKAKPIRQFVQFQPNEGHPLTQPTDVRILYDEKKIYFGFTCFDDNMSEMVANLMRRDAPLFENDNVFVLLDTYNDQRSGFFFRVNPLGAIEDAAVMNSGDSQNENWDAVWECETRINSEDWTAEIAIPFSQLRFRVSDDMTWGLNLGRSLRRNNQEGTWAPVPGSYSWRARYRTANLGNLRGLREISAPRNLELRPYVLPGVSQSGEQNDISAQFNIGLDIKSGLTSNLTGDMTINTDFAQVESDEEQVNLTRFSLFFQEKRPFFLEGAGLFDFGIPRTNFRVPPPLLLFYSRRIGLEEGYAVPILAGGKITGKVGPYGVGLLNVLTDDFYTDASVTDTDDIVNIQRTNYSVLRVKRDIFSSSSLGIIAINKQDAETYNRSGGIDFTYRPSDNVNVRGLWARTSKRKTLARNNALYFSSGWQTNDFRLIGSYMDIGENFNPEVGFVRRTGIRRILGEIRFTPTLGRFGFRRLLTGPGFDLILNQDNELETRNIIFTNTLEFQTGGWIGFQVQRTFEFLDEDFEIRDNIIIPVGKYHFTSYRLILTTPDTQKFSSEWSVNFSDFFNGKRRGFDIEVNFRPSVRFNLQPRYEFNHVILPSHSFNTSILGTHIWYSFSTKLLAKLFAQWNTDSDVISTNFLLNYIYRPGCNFYLVFNHVYKDVGGKKTSC